MFPSADAFTPAFFGHRVLHSNEEKPGLPASTGIIKIILILLKDP
jgi:hypothetical protein